MLMRSGEWRSVSVLAITAPRRFAATATTVITRMRALLTDTTAPATSWAASSSAPDPGSTVGASMAADITGVAGSTVTAGVIGAGGVFAGGARPAPAPRGRA